MGPENTTAVEDTTHDNTPAQETGDMHGQTKDTGTQSIA